ncbi:MAG: OmpH family outer membrane protein, partial [Saprospiraceae bacterium]
GLKIAYVNGDTILMNYKEFRAQSQTMDAKQKDAEDMLQQKGAALEREYNEYQRNAQKGTMTGKEMQAQEKYLSSKQEALLAERDKLAKEIMDETTSINDRLQKVMQDKLAAIKKREGYDFIFSYIHGGAILLADEKYDITAEVLKELNSEAGDHPMEKDSAK